jgi:hypothetical protein
MSHEIEKEISLGHRDDLVGDLHEQAKTFCGLEAQSIGNTLTKVFGPRARVDLERFVRVVRKVDFVEDLRRFVLNRFHLDLMWWIFSLAISYRKIKRTLMKFNLHTTPAVTN